MRKTTKVKIKDVLESMFITAIVVGVIALFPILFVAFIKYGDWVVNLVGLNQ